MDKNTIITGPYADHKSSQAHPYAVNVFQPGVGGERHRFESRDKAEAFAAAQRAVQS